MSYPKKILNEDEFKLFRKKFEITEKKKYKENKNAQLAFLSQEFSRRTMNWTLFYKFNPVSIFDLLGLPDFCIIAGGAVLSIISETKIMDIDVFFVGDYNKINKYINELRNLKHLESQNCITIIKNNYKLQFIKRIYEKPEHIIGGFDLDICRVMYYDQFIISTINFELSFLKRELYINHLCISKSYNHRVMKYSRKGYWKCYPRLRCGNTKRYKIFGNKSKSLGYYFRRHYARNKQNISDYANIFNMNNVVYDNLCFILLGLYDNIYTMDNYIIPIDDFYLEIDDPNIHKKVSVLRILGIPALREHVDEYTKFASWAKFIIKLRYPKYKEFLNIRITNTGTQFTNSFNPDLNKTKKYLPCYKKINYFKLYPELYYILKNKIFCKYLRHNIAKYYFENFIEISKPKTQKYTPLIIDEFDLKSEF